MLVPYERYSLPVLILRSTCVNDTASFLSSEVFRIQGPQGKSFFIHGGLLSRRSEGLAIHVNGEMLEAETKEIIIEAVDDDIDDDTVVRFVEYAYTGDYTPPGPDVLLTSSDIGSQSRNGNANMDLEQVPYTKTVVAAYPELGIEPQREPSTMFVDSWDMDFNSNKLRKKMRKFGNHWSLEKAGDNGQEVGPRKSKAVMWRDFCEKVSSAPIEQRQPQSRNGSNEDFTNVLLCHARLYIFSSRWECHDLRDLVLQKLRLTLSKYAVTADKIIEITTLIHYVYDHTQNYISGGIDRLRDLIMDFVVCHVEVIEPDPEFRELLMKENEIGRDLLTKLMQRLN